MAYKFNPFTGTLDYYVSGGGAGIAIDGTSITTAVIPFEFGLSIPSIDAFSAQIILDQDDALTRSLSFNLANNRVTLTNPETGGKTNVHGQNRVEITTATKTMTLFESATSLFSFDVNFTGATYIFDPNVTLTGGATTADAAKIILGGDSNCYIKGDSAVGGIEISAQGGVGFTQMYFRSSSLMEFAAASTSRWSADGGNYVLEMSSAGIIFTCFGGQPLQVTGNLKLDSFFPGNSLAYVNGSKIVSPVTISSPLSLSAGTLSLTTPGSDTQFLYNNAGALAGSSFFTLGTNNIPTVGDGNAQITSIGTCTISNASPCVVTKAGHGLAINDRVTFRTTGGLPAPLHPEDLFDGVREYYYIISAGFGVNSFQISLTRGGAAINTTTAGSGTQTLYKYVNYELDFNSNADVLLEWRQDPASTSQWTFSVRRSDDTYFQYPGYAARFAVNCTQVTDYESPVAFSAFINAGAATSELYGFWGGVYDSDAGGTTAFGVSSQAIGILCYNTMFGTTARTVTNLIGGDFTSEIGANLSGTGVYGGRFQAIVAATSATFTNAYGVRVLSPGGGTFTNNYGIHLAEMTGGTNNFSLFIAAAGGAHFRAIGQKVYSSAASTIDIDTVTTGNLRVGGTIEYTWNATTFTFGEANNIAFGTTTGTKIGTATTQKLAFYNATPIVQPSAYTQTFSTASKTVPNATATSVATTASTNVAPFGYTTAAQADAIVTNLNACIVDIADAKKVINALIDDLQALGLVG